MHINKKMNILKKCEQLKTFRYFTFNGVYLIKIGLLVPMIFFVEFGGFPLHLQRTFVKNHVQHEG